MTKFQKLGQIKRLYKPWSRKYGYKALCRRYGLDINFCRYWLEPGNRERAIKNALRWQNENKDKRAGYMKKYFKKRNETKLLSKES